MLTDRVVSPPAGTPHTRHPGLSQRRIRDCSRSAHE